MSISQQHDKHIWRVVLPARVGQIHSVGLALAAAMALMAVCEQVAHAQETIGDIQRKIVEYRSSIDHGKLQIKTLVQYPTLVPIEKEEITVDLYFRGEDVRADRHFLFISGDKPSGVFDERRVIADGTYIYDEVGKMHVAVEMGTFERDQLHELSKVVTSGAIDPRVLGLVPERVIECAKYGLEDAVIRYLSPIKSPLRPEELDGEKVIVGSYIRDIRGVKGEYTYWIAPEKGYGLLKAEAMAPPPLISRRMEARYREFPGQLWFPYEIVFEKRLGQELTYREVTSIDGSFADPVDPSMFTLAGLKLTPGRRVRSSGQMMLWDGQGLLPVVTLPERTPVTLEEGMGTWRTLLLIANAIIVAALACLLVVKWFGKKAAS